MKDSLKIASGCGND